MLEALASNLVRFKCAMSSIIKALLEAGALGTRLLLKHDRYRVVLCNDHIKAKLRDEINQEIVDLLQPSA